jgi:altronate dehydratase small subunit
VLKYGESIGVASSDIQMGQLVHVHNLEGARGRGDLAEEGVT